jgi:hypothetical protein
MYNDFVYGYSSYLSAQELWVHYMISIVYQTFMIVIIAIVTTVGTWTHLIGHRKILDLRKCQRWSPNFN